MRRCATFTLAATGAAARSERTLGLNRERVKRRRNRKAVRRGGKAQYRSYQRAAAAASPVRASTQRSPSGVRSFFQNGA